MSELQGLSATEEVSSEEVDLPPPERLAERHIIDEIASVVTKEAVTGTRFYTRFLKSFKDKTDGSQLLLSSYGLDNRYAPSRWYSEKPQPRALASNGTADLLASLPDNRLVGVEVIRYSKTEPEADLECVREEYLVVYDERECDFKLRQYSYSAEGEERIVDLSHEDAQVLLQRIKMCTE